MTVRLRMLEAAVSVSAEIARAELARRELARRHLVDFSSYIAGYYRPARHHRLVGEYLELVETYIRTRGRTGIGRLLILEPPRHGKSEQASIHFPAWMLGKHPDSRVIVVSYGLDLASKFSRQARDIVMGEKYANVFGVRGTVDAAVEISSDSRSTKAWDLAAPHRGGMVAAGVGGGITGMGANLMVIDDPFKNREEAESESHRESVWEWWTSTAYTRLEDGAAVVGMLTRWHGDDWAGRLLKAMASDPKADQWVVVCLPALCENLTNLTPDPETGKGSLREERSQLTEIAEERQSPRKPFEEYQREMLLQGVWVEREDPLGRRAGEALWPEKYNVDDLRHIEANVGPYDWQALYQQSPYSRLGNMFKRGWFPLSESWPTEGVVKRVRYWDKAGSSSGDHSAGVRMSITADEVVYVEHVSRGQWTPKEREEEMIRAGKLDAELGNVETWHQQDPGSAGIDSAQATNFNLARYGITAHFEPVTGDKETRAGPWSSACEAGRVRLVRGGWNEAFIEEHVAFPKGKYDDQVDAASSAFAKIFMRQGSGIWA